MRIERQLGIIGKAATDNEIEDMIEKSKNGEAVPIFTGVSFFSKFPGHLRKTFDPPWGRVIIRPQVILLFCSLATPLDQYGRAADA